MASLSIQNLFGVVGKTVAVTGGARGIGRMIANAFVANGATVYISSRKASVCETAVQELNATGPGKAYAFPSDLSTPEGCKEFAHYLKEQTGDQGLNVLINNSGTSWAAPLDKFPDDAWDKVLSLNLKSPFWLTRDCLPLLEKGSVHSPPSRIVNIGSITGIQPQNVATYPYDVSKAAVHHLTKKLSVELAKRGNGITCNAIAPGWVPTDMGKQLLHYTTKDKMVEGIPLRREGREADMAGAALYLCSNAASWVTGITIPVDGGAVAIPIQMGGEH